MKFAEFLNENNTSTIKKSDLKREFKSKWKLGKPYEENYHGRKEYFLYNDAQYVDPLKSAVPDELFGLKRDDRTNYIKKEIEKFFSNHSGILKSTSNGSEFTFNKDTKKEFIITVSVKHFGKYDAPFIHVSFE